MSSILSKLINLAGNITGTLGISNGGTGQVTASTAFNALSPMTTAGDIIYGGVSGAGTRLGAGSSSQVLLGGTTPSWGGFSITNVGGINQYNIPVGDVNNNTQVVNTNLLGDVNANYLSQTATVTIATPGVFTSNNHGMANGDKFYLTTTGALPTGLSPSTTYFASNVSTNSFNASTTLANAAALTYIATSGSQSGTHTLFTGGLVFERPNSIRGIIDGSSPTAGYIGEVISSGATSVTLSTSSATTIVSITLTPGYWQVSGSCVQESTAALNNGITATLNILGAGAGSTDGLNSIRILAIANGNFSGSGTFIPQIVNVTSSTSTKTVILGGQANTAACNAGGYLYAIRIR